MVHEGIDLAKLLGGFDHDPVVYFLRLGGWVKIGTSTNLMTRVNALSVTIAEVAKVIPGGPKVEAEFHRTFAKYRIYQNREWFREMGELRQYLNPDEAIPLVPDQRGEDQVRAGVTLTEALRDGLVIGSLDAVRKASQRKGFPASVGTLGAARLYLPDDLIRWQHTRPRAAG